MGLEQVADDIREEGRAEAERLTDEAEEEAQRILEAAREEAEEIKAARREDLEERVASLRRQELAGARLAAKKQRLAAERTAMEAVQTAFRERVANLPAAERERHLEALVKQANVPEGSIFVAGGDEKLAEDLGLEVAGTFDGLGGVRVASPDGDVVENLQYTSILGSVWRDSLHDVAEELFKDA